LPQEAQDSLAASIPFPRRLGHADEFASLALHMIDNPYLTRGGAARCLASAWRAPEGRPVSSEVGACGAFSFTSPMGRVGSRSDPGEGVTLIITA